MTTYDRHGLVDRRCVLAHNVHPTDVELKMLAVGGATVAHCPTSNAALGQRAVPARAGICSTAYAWLSGRTSAPAPGFSLLKEGLQAYFGQQLLGDHGLAADLRPPALPGHRRRR